MNDAKQALECRHYAAYTGARLPLKPITRIDDCEIQQRNTYFRGYYDDRSCLVALEKVAYGEVEFKHRYSYHADGRIKAVELLARFEAPRVMRFD